MDIEPELPGGHWRPRLMAALEVTLCSGYPTQLVLVYVLAVSGVSVVGPSSVGRVSLLLFVDASAVMLLAIWFLKRRGESVRAVFLGSSPQGREALLGLPLVVVALILATSILLAVQLVAPWLRNVTENPLEQLLQSGRDATLFGVVATYAGGIREEIQRAFILHRFRQHLGGAWVGVVVFSIAFGAGHALQGWDAAIATGCLGAFWGLVYLRRGSIVAPMVSHVGFNLFEIVQFMVWGR